MSEIRSERKQVLWLPGIRVCQIAMAFALLFGVCVSTFAFQIDTGKENVEMNWDNTFRYNYGARVNNPDTAIIANPNLDDGDRNFDKGTVMNRLDILSEFDVSYKRTYGVRLSVAAWYDQRYHDHLGRDSSTVGSSNHLENGVQSLGLS